MEDVRSNNEDVRSDNDGPFDVLFGGTLDPQRLIRRGQPRVGVMNDPGDRRSRFVVVAVLMN